MSLIIFSAFDGSQTGLWVTDGTAAGTTFLAPLDDSVPSLAKAPGGGAYFVEPDRSIWFTDGSAESTHQVSPSGSLGVVTANGLDFYEASSGAGVGLYVIGGGANGLLAPQVGSGPVVALGDQVVFVGEDAAHGDELWISDGTTSGTRLLADIDPGPDSSSPSSLTTAGGKVFFVASSATGPELWSTDGTVTGTQAVDLDPVIIDAATYGQISALTPLGDGVAFQTFINGAETIWFSDGTAGGTVQLATGLSSTSSWLTTGAELFFQLNDELWESNGTAAGTLEVGAMYPVAAVQLNDGSILIGSNVYSVSRTASGATELLSGVSVTSWAELNGLLYLSGFSATVSQGLWVTDGSVAGTRLIVDLPTGGQTGGFIQGLTAANGALFFSAFQPSTGQELWTSDGTAAGTHLVDDINGPTTDAPLGISQLTSWGSDVAVVASAGLYLSDGAAVGTQLIVPSAATEYGTTISVVATTSKAIFYTLANDNDLFGWTAAAGSVDLSQTLGAATDYSQSYAFNPTVLGDQVYFAGGQGLFQSDGTTAGSRMVASVSVSSAPISWNGDLVFVGDTATQSGVFAFDPAMDALHLLDADANVSPLLASGNSLYLVQRSGLPNDEIAWTLLKTTNAAAPPSAVATFDTNLFDTAQPFADLVGFDGGALYAASDGLHAQQLWFSPGGGGAAQMITINRTTANQPFTADDITEVNGVTYFVGGDQFDEGLWTTDGTASGTRLIAPSDPQDAPGSALPYATELAALPAGLFFSYGDGQAELLASGAAAPVALGGPEIASAPVQAGADIFWLAQDPQTDWNDLYESDGAAGSAQEVVGGVRAITAIGDKVFYAAQSGGLDVYDASTGLATSLSSSASLARGLQNETLSLNGELLFGAVSGNQAQVWETDGTTTGTMLLAAFSAEYGASPTGFQAFGSGFLFQTESEYNSNSLAGLYVDVPGSGLSEITSDTVSDVVVDGSSAVFIDHNAWTGSATLEALSQTGQAGTIPFSGLAGEGVSDLTVAGGTVFFVASDTEGVGQIWALESGAPVQITSDALFIQSLFATSSALYWSGAVSGGPTGFYTADASPNSDRFVTSGSGAPIEGPATVAGNEIFFTDNGQLWVTSGGYEQAVQLTSTTSAQSAEVTNLTIANGVAYFDATDGVHGQQLWDLASAAGSPTMLTTNGIVAEDIQPFGSGIVFVTNSGSPDTQLWTDGGAAGTLTSFGEVAPEYGAPPYVVSGGDLYFVDAATNHVMAVSGSSTVASAVETSEAASLFTVAGGEVYFYGADSTFGAQLWETNGEPGGTSRLTESTSDGGSSPSQLTVIGASSAPSPLIIESTNGAVVEGLLQSGQEVYSQLGALGPEWRFEGAGDLLGDGQRSFLIQNTAGAVVDAEVSGAALTYDQIAALGPEWQVVGVGDLLGVGDDQFLIENTNGAVVVGQAETGQAQFSQIGALGPEWRFVGVGDFKNDGKAQFLIENTAGVLAMGEVVQGQSQYAVVGALGPEWRFEEVGDFLGNGATQFLMENTTGAVVLGQIVSGQAQYAQVAALGPEWTFVGAGDYSGAGKASFLIENTNGAVVEGAIGNGQASYALLTALGPEWSFRA